MGNLKEEWSSRFFDLGLPLKTEEDVIEFIFDKLNVNDFEGGCVQMGNAPEPNCCFKITESDVYNLFYDFMMSLVKKETVESDQPERIRRARGLPYMFLSNTQEHDIEDFFETVKEFVDESKLGNINIHVEEDGSCIAFCKTDTHIFYAEKGDLKFEKHYEERPNV